jgi:hypothetical protein
MKYIVEHQITVEAEDALAAVLGARALLRAGNEGRMLGFRIYNVFDANMHWQGRLDMDVEPLEVTS